MGYADGAAGDADTELGYAAHIDVDGGEPAEIDASSDLPAFLTEDDSAAALDGAAVS